MNIRALLSGGFLLMASALMAQPRISFDRTQHDFGYLIWKSPATTTFTFTNTGDQPLVVSNVTTSCGCTLADWTHSPIAPGESGQVTATFDAAQTGRFHKTVGVYCNAYDLPLYLTLSGEVTMTEHDISSGYPHEVGMLRLDKDEIVFEDAQRGEHPTVELFIANHSSQVYTPILMHLPPYLKAEAVPERIGRNRTGKVIVTLDTEKLPKLGITTASVYVSRYLGDKVSDENELKVSAVLLPDFSHLTAEERQNEPVVDLSETMLEVGELPENKKASRVITITNNGRRALEIQDLQVLNASLGVQLKTRRLEPGASTKMKVTVTGRLLAKSKGSMRILMITNDPEQPKSVIHVKATLKK
jgi:archaellum component FlaF (FlaF/FlaG flagellin family)